MAATTVEAEERVVFPSRRGNRLVGVLHGARATGDVPAVILCHGMESTKEGTKHRRLAEWLAARGIAALRFDFSYVGESDGSFEDLTFSGEVEDLGGAWDYLRTRVSGKVAIVGSSMGGAVALLFASAEPAVHAVATIAAVGRPARALEELRPTELDRWRKDGVFSLGGMRLKSSFLLDVETLDVIGACARIACPAFVTHGDADRVVPCSDGEEIAAALGARARLKIYPGADHRFSKPSDLDELLADLGAWLVREIESAAR